MDTTNFIPDPIYWAGETPEKLATRNQERGEWGFCWSDWINFFHYNAWVMANAIGKLRDEAHGYPVYGECQSMEDWQRILDEIRDGFVAVLNEEAGPADDEDMDEYLATVGAVYEETSRKLARSFELLGIYYRSLWD